MTLPGSAVGAGRALTVGENEVAPRVTFFSVGCGALAGALELGEGDLVSAGFSFEEHAVSDPMVTERPRRSQAQTAESNVSTT